MAGALRRLHYGRQSGANGQRCSHRIRAPVSTLGWLQIAYLGRGWWALRSSPHAMIQVTILALPDNGKRGRNLQLLATGYEYHPNANVRWFPVVFIAPGTAGVPVGGYTNTRVDCRDGSGWRARGNDIIVN